MVGFDVAINPQEVNVITDHNYPLKIDEYLAMGCAVVATKTVFMDYFKNETYLACTKEEYVVMIRKALAENSADKAAERNRVAKTHTWENFVLRVYGALMEVKPDF